MFFAGTGIREDVVQLKLEEKKALGELHKLQAQDDVKQLQGHELAGELKTEAQESLKTATDEGRIELLQKIVDHPDEHLKDMHRVAELWIGGEPLDDIEYDPTKTEYNVFLVGHALKSFIEKKDPNRTVSKSTVNELLCGEPRLFGIAAFFDTVWLSKGYGLIPSSQKAHFEYTPPEVIITRAIDAKYKHWDTDRADQLPKFDVSVEIQCRYNLNTQEVTFTNSYTIDGKKTTFEPTKKPFPKKSISSDKEERRKEEDAAIKSIRNSIR